MQQTELRCTCEGVPADVESGIDGREIAGGVVIGVMIVFLLFALWNAIRSI